MSEAALDEQVAKVMLGLIQVRGLLHPDTFGDLLGSVMTEIDQGFEIAMEATFRGRAEGNVIPFPGRSTNRQVDNGDH